MAAGSPLNKYRLSGNFRSAGIFVMPSGKSGISVLCCIVAGFLSLSESCRAMEEIKPPFGFQWGESPTRLEKMLTQAKARVVEKTDVDGRLQIEVAGISQRLLQSSYFYFKEDALEEVELHYGDPSWSSQQYSSFFDQTRRHIDQRYGSGKLVARSRSSQNGIVHSLIGYQWTQVGGTLQLFLFTAEQGAQQKKILSLHYRGS